MNRSQNYYGGGGAHNKNSSYANLSGGGGRDDGQMLVWEATRIMKEGFLGHYGDMPRLLDLAHNLSQHLEHTREQYNRVVREREAAHRRLNNANQKLASVETLVKRYADVREPVIASDGYTYESESITKYLKECSKGSTKAYSQLTKEELTDVTVPNNSLNRLVTRLKEMRPIEVAPPVPRHAIPAYPAGGGGGGMAPRTVWSEEDRSASVGLMPVRPLDANSPPQPAGATGATVGGITVPAPASAGNNNHHHSSSNAAAGGGRGNRFDAGGKMRGGGGGGGPRPPFHPCLRVYGFCNFMDDCTFANYPYEACLNHIKGKCRFGPTCKELHVDPRDPRYQNARSYANQQHQHQQQQQQIVTAAAAAAPAEAVTAKAEKKTGSATEAAEPAAAEKTAVAVAVAAATTTTAAEADNEATKAAEAKADTAAAAEGAKEAASEGEKKASE